MSEISIIELSEDELIQHATGILETRLRYRVSDEAPEPLTTPQVVKDFLKLKLAELPHEVFAALFLDNRHRLIRYEEMFRGTIDGASVHPREVVKAALQHNAAALILAHNHPSGVPEPSRADEALTRRLREALGLIDVRVLDHVIVGGTDTTSFAELGLI
jgi:DNA repair protein RadC